MYDDLMREGRTGDCQKISLMRNEMVLSAECRVCRHVFRTLQSFFHHKELYCSQRAADVLLQMPSLFCLDPKVHDKQTVVKSRRKARKASSDAESSQTSEGAGTRAPSRRGRQRKRTSAAAETKAKSTARLVFEKQVKPPSSMESAVSPPIPEVTSGQLPNSDGPRRPRKPAVKLQSSLHATVDKPTGQAASNSMEEVEEDKNEPLAQELPVSPPRSEVTPGQLSSCVVSRRPRKMHSPLHAIVDKLAAKAASTCICEEEEDKSDTLAQGPLVSPPRSEVTPGQLFSCVVSRRPREPHLQMHSPLHTTVDKPTGQAASKSMVEEEEDRNEALAQEQPVSPRQEVTPGQLFNSDDPNRPRKSPVQMCNPLHDFADKLVAKSTSKCMGEVEEDKSESQAQGPLVSSLGSEVTPGQLSSSDVSRKPWKSPEKMHSPLFAVVDKPIGKVASKSICEEEEDRNEALAQGPAGQPFVSSEACRRLAVGLPIEQVHTNAKSSVDALYVPAAEDQTSGCDSTAEDQTSGSDSTAEDQTSGCDSTAEDQTSGCDSTAEAQCKEMSLSLADQAGTSGIANGVQESEPSTKALPPSSSFGCSSASGQIRSSQPALQRYRTSTRERKAPKKIQEREEEARGKATFGNKKRSAPKSSADEKDKKEETSSKSTKKSRLGDGQSYSKPDAQNAAAKPVKKHFFPCDQCNMAFASKRYLTVHTGQRHRKKQESEQRENALPAGSSFGCSSAPGQTGSCGPTLQNIRTSIRERKAPKKMQEREEGARCKAISGSRKRSAPKSTADKDKKEETSSKSTKKSRLGDGQGFAKPPDAQNAAAMSGSEKCSAPLGPTDEKDKNDETSGPATKLRLGDGQDFAISPAAAMSGSEKCSVPMGSADKTDKKEETQEPAMKLRLGDGQSVAKPDAQNAAAKPVKKHFFPCDQCSMAFVSKRYLTFHTGQRHRKKKESEQRENVLPAGSNFGCSSAPGQTGSCGPTLQNIRTSIRERKAPKKMQEREEGARCKAISGSRKHSAPKGTADKDKKEETSSKPTKKSNLGDGQGFAKPPDAQNAAAMSGSAKCSAPLGPTDEKDKNDETSGPATKLRLGDGQDFAISPDAQNAAAMSGSEKCSAPMGSADKTDKKEETQEPAMKLRLGDGQSYAKPDAQNAAAKPEKKHLFPCDQCNMTFASKRYLTFHTGQRHRKKQESEQSENALPAGSNFGCSSAPGQTGSCGPTLQRSWTSTQESEASKKMQEHEKGARVQAISGIRKRSALMGSADKKARQRKTCKSTKRVELDDGQGCVQLIDVQNPVAMRVKMQNFECDKCNMTFTHKSSLTYHTRQKHSGNPNAHYCHLCIDVFQDLRGLMQHLRKTHKMSWDRMLACEELELKEAVMPLLSECSILSVSYI